MKSKQQTTEKPTDHRRNKKGNQNMHGNKWKYDNPKPMGFNKSSAKTKAHSNISIA